MNKSDVSQFILYRGDSIPAAVQSSVNPHRVLAEHFCGLGLVARSFCGEIPRAVFDKPLDQVLAHVSHERGTPEQTLAEHSPLISFSESLKSAFSFMEGTGRSNLTRCRRLHKATHFVWRLRLDRGDLQPMPPGFPSHEGWYWFHYRADPVNCLEHMMRRVEEAYDLEAGTGEAHELASSLGQCAAAAHAAADSRDHHAIIIDACTFIERNCRGKRLYEQALHLARHHREWLLYPYDMSEDGCPSGVFQMNKNLSLAALYRGKKR